MKNYFYLIAILLIGFTLSCSSDDEDQMTEVPVDPDPLTISSINGFVSTGTSTFQVTNLMLSENTLDLRITTPIIVTFAKPVKNDWLTNETLPRLMKTENGEAVEGVSISITVESNTELLIEPNSELENETTYMFVINAGYQAQDEGILEDPVIVNFTTVN